MKNLVHYITFSITLLVVFSCNNDFLTDEPNFFGEGSPIVISPNWEVDEYSIYYQGIGSAKFTVAHTPSWLKVSSPSGQFINNVVTLNCKANVHSAFSEVGIYHSFITLSVEGRGDLAVPVMYITEGMDLGNPVLNIRESESGTINFGRTETSRQFAFSNQGNGILIWMIEGRPEWLTVSESTGALISYNSTVLTFTCNRDLMQSTINTATIILKTNDKNKPSYPITVTARSNIANTDNIKTIEGNITDAYMDKQSDILYLTTGQPNRLLAYDTKTRTIAREVPLSYTPTCFSLSEDGHKVVIGHGGYITSVDLDNFSVLKTVEVDHIIHDIEWGEEDWCCYSVPDVQWTSLYWVNLNTNEKNSFDQIYEKCRLRKIPGQNYILGAEVNLSDGVYVFDINTRKRIYDIFAYVGYFWFSENGDHLYTGSSVFSFGGSVYRTSSFFNQADVFPIGNFSPAPYHIFWIDHHAVSQNVWVISSSSNDFYNLQVPREIIQYEDKNYTRKATYYYDEYHNGRPVHAYYVFARQDGTELVVIKNATSGDFMWSLEFISVTN